MTNVVDDCGTICGQKPRYRYEEILWKKVQEIIDLLNSIEPGGGEMIDQQTKILTILNTPLRG